MLTISKLRAAIQFLRDSAWVDDPNWEEKDSNNLTAFLVTESGRKFSDLLLNLTLRQQAQALSTGSGLKYKAGYCNGVKGACLFIESLARKPEPTTDSGDQTPTADE